MRRPCCRKRYGSSTCTCGCRASDVATLEHFAERDRTTVSGVLAWQLNGVASAQAEDFVVDSGFADARVAEASQLPC